MGLCFHSPPAVLITHPKSKLREREGWRRERERVLSLRVEKRKKKQRRQKKSDDHFSLFFFVFSFPEVFQINPILMSGRALVAALAAAVLLAGTGE